MKVVTRALTVSELSAFKGELANKSTLVWDLKYRLARDVYLLVLEHVTRTKSVKYSEIAKLSQKLRDVTPVAFNSILSSHQPHQSSSLMSGYLCSQYQFCSKRLRTLSHGQH